MENTNNKFSVRDIAYMGLCVALLTLCSWFTVPMTVSFTMQTFAIFFIVLFLGPVKSLITLLAWFTLGIIGAPVFANFKGGLNVIIGPTGGYIIGFFFTPILYIITGSIFKKHKWVNYIITMVVGLFICYLIGTLWFIYVYAKGVQTVMYVLGICVFPFIIPDLLKLALAVYVGQRVAVYMKHKSMKPLTKFQLEPMTLGRQK